MGVVILGWAGIGNSTLGRKYPDMVADMESSRYQWDCEPSEANKGRTDRQRNPLYPDNYLLAIKDAMQTHPIVCVALRSEMVQALKQEGIPFYIVYPPIEDMALYQQRYVDRGNVLEFYAKSEEMWERVRQGTKDTSGQTIVLDSDSHLEAYLRSPRSVLGVTLPEV